MKEMTAAQVLGDVRIPHDIVAGMIVGAAETLDDVTLSQRLRMDRIFYLGASDMTQSLVMATTLAQTMKPQEAFATMFEGARFADGDSDLVRLGQRMYELILTQPRLPDPDISDELLAERMKVVQTAIV